MKLRIARKILARMRTAPNRWTRDQIRRAALRVLTSPLQVTSAPGEGDLWGNAANVARFLGGRLVGISAACAVFEQRRFIVDAVKRDGRIYMEPRP